MTDLLPSLERTLLAQADGNQPEALFQAAEAACRDLFGFRFLTILKNLPGTGNVMRMHSSTAGDYPVGALKPMGNTPWGKIVLDGGESWLGNSREDVLWAFPDAELILSKGCEACACAPVRWKGETVGVLSLNAERDAYSTEDLQYMTLIAQALVPALI